MMNDLEWRLRHLEELALLLGQEAAVMKPAIAKLMQDESMFRQGPATQPVAGNITVTCYSETGVYSGASVTLKNNTTGLIIDTQVSDGSGVVTFNAPIGSTSYTVSSQPAGKTLFVFESITVPTTTSTWSLVALLYGTATTLTAVDSVWGSMTLSYNNAPGGFNSGAWIGSKAVSYAACAATGCSAATNVLVEHRFFNRGLLTPNNATTLHLVERYSSQTANTCPGNQTFGVFQNVAPNWTAGTLTPQPLNLAYSLTATTGSAQRLYCNGSPTLSITQP